ncbi:hypothetical protein [Microbacterium sp.]|uniref:hypothetical protein n=1 Tax=Microbacterium sp. TaxID=51671 RepID=UPI0039E4165E
MITAPSGLGSLAALAGEYLTSLPGGLRPSCDSGWMRRAGGRELLGWLGAAGLAVAVSAQVAASARSELLFRDGDSLVVAMLSRSILSGERLDWAMSSVLFVPETALYALLSVTLPFDVNGLLAVNAVLNVIALYGALRLTAGRRSPHAAPVSWTLTALAAFGLLAVTETSASRDALELASLLLTTTYYSSTVISMIAVCGLIRRGLDGASAWTLAAVAPIALVATMSNPLFAAWTTAPVVVVLAVLLLRTRRRGRMLAAAAVLAGGTALGFLARIPLSAWITNSGAGYAQPERWIQSLGYYDELLAARLSDPPGLIAAATVLGLLAVGVVRTLRADSDGERFLAAASWIVPLLVTVGAVALGTHAARYLQPVVLAPLLALVAAPRPVRAPKPLVWIAAAAIAVACAFGSPRLSDAAHRPDADLDCVVDWVNASGRTGAGQFWTVRLPKAHLDDPAQLVQVDHRLDDYAWLVNRTDFTGPTPSFLIEDAQTVPWDLPEQPTTIATCGRYTILAR